ncbi:MAG: hypothetical protein F6K28_28860, partial [Microcoleus sp. SIO2G3]|nr:hypothetical protein [Microcoleus sp. SIO2G3]
MTGFEPLIAQAVSGVAVPVFQSIWAGGGKILDRFGKALDAKKAKQAIDAASRQYAQNYTERHAFPELSEWRAVRCSSEHIA